MDIDKCPKEIKDNILKSIFDNHLWCVEVEIDADPEATKDEVILDVMEIMQSNHETCFVELIDWIYDEIKGEKHD